MNDTKADPVEHIPEISEEDVIEGMRAIEGYIDLTPYDFKKLYEKVYVFTRRRILRETHAADIMTQPVVTVRETDSLEQLVRLLAEHSISGVPVVDGQDKITGVISEKDILCFMGRDPKSHIMRLIADSLFRPLCLDAESRNLKVSGIMSSPARCVEEGTSLGDIIAMFETKAINRLPVTDEEGKAAGIITRDDMITAISRRL